MATITTSLWQDLVVSLLAVYNWPIDKVDTMSAKFSEQGLFDMANLATFSHAEIYDRLEKSGYKRGNLNGIFIERLQSLGKAAIENDKFESILKSNNISQIEMLLQPVKGVGQKVLDNFFILRGIKSC